MGEVETAPVAPATEEGDDNKRDTRQRRLVPPDRLAKAHAVVVGVGAIGRQVALQLAAMGTPRVTLIDHDTVEAVNLGPQGFLAADVGRRKALAVRDHCRAINPDGLFYDDVGRFRSSYGESYDANTAVFCCVDSIETRARVWEAVSPRAGFFVDGRMSAETVRVLASASPLTDAYYKTTLFSAAEAHRGACTARSTIYSASLAASFMVGQFAVWLRGGEVTRDFMLNMVAMELTLMDQMPVTAGQ